MEPNLRGEWCEETLGPFGEFPDKKTPYKIHIFPNFLDDTIFNQLRNDVRASVKLKSKDNDLYRFKQSRDFKTEIPSKKLPNSLHEFIDMMLGKVRKQLEKSTGLILSEKHFDITASRYDKGNYLLCHNDDVRDNVKKHARCLAYIYYLNSQAWGKEDGGALELYDCDEQGEPVSLSNRITPTPNSLIVFPTSSTSWHSVEEVYRDDDIRLSINGWFHVDNAQPPSEPSEDMIEPCPLKMYRPMVPEERLVKFIEEYVNPDYVLETTCAMIRKKFKRQSEINLTNFLVKEKFEEIDKALREACCLEENLVQVGPYNKRNYKALRIDRLPPVCRDLFDVFRSDLFFMILSRLTGLELSPPNLKERINNALDKREDNKKVETSQQVASKPHSDAKNGKLYDGGDDHDDSEEDDDDSEDDEDDEDDETSSDEEDEDDEVNEEDEEDEDENENEGERDEYVQDPSKSISSTLKGELKEKEEVVKADIKAIEGGTTSQGESKKRPLESNSGNCEQRGKPPKKKKKKTSDPLARFEFRHFEHGSYTLIHDHGYELGERSALDAILHFNHDFEVNYDDGGYLSYIDGSPEEDLHNMDYELLTVNPASNCLTLVYRCDEATVRFLKHINKSHKGNYQDLCCVYYERSADLPKSTGGIVEN